MHSTDSKRRDLSLLLMVMIGVALLGGSVLAKKPPSPQPPECDGTPIEVVNDQSCGETITILIEDSVTVCDIECLVNQSTKRGKKPPSAPCPMTFISWIGGIVVPDASAEHGFYFDPTTVIVAEITAEGLQTNVCQISDHLAMYEGGLWYIPYIPTEIRDAD